MLCTNREKTKHFYVEFLRWKSEAHDFRHDGGDDGRTATCQACRGPRKPSRVRNACGLRLRLRLNIPPLRHSKATHRRRKVALWGSRAMHTRLVTPLRSDRCTKHGLHRIASLETKHTETGSQLIIKRYKKGTLTCTEGPTASQSVPNGSYGPYAHITSIGNACGAKLKARARKISRICSPGANGRYASMG